MKTLTVILFVFTSFCFNVTSFGQSAEVSILTSAQCNMCKERIEKTLLYTSGVVSSSLDVDTKYVKVVYKSKKTNPDRIRIAISKVGYQADDLKADPLAYEKLPSCCQLQNDSKKCNH